MNLAQATTYNPAVSARKASEYLDVAYRRLLSMTAEGKIPALKTEGGHYKYRLSDLNAYLEGLRINPEARA